LPDKPRTPCPNENFFRVASTFFIGDIKNRNFSGNQSSIFKGYSWATHEKSRNPGAVNFFGQGIGLFDFKGKKYWSRLHDSLPEKIFLLEGNIRVEIVASSGLGPGTFRSRVESSSNKFSKHMLFFRHFISLFNTSLNCLSSDTTLKKFGSAACEE
jgi:hypothetical protein